MNISKKNPKNILLIVKYPDPILRQKAKKIKNPLAEEVQTLIPLMIETMRQNQGVGLAAPQIGKSLQLFVVDKENGQATYVFINPKITACSREKNKEVEGCLSIPNKILPVERYETITVRYLNEKGEKSKLKARGFLARAIQHELDHLNGILILDHQ